MEKYEIYLYLKKYFFKQQIHTDLLVLDKEQI